MAEGHHHHHHHHQKLKLINTSSTPLRKLVCHLIRLQANYQLITVKLLSLYQWFIKLFHAHMGLFWHNPCRTHICFMLLVLIYKLLCNAGRAVSYLVLQCFERVSWQWFSNNMEWHTYGWILPHTTLAILHVTSLTPICGSLLLDWIFNFKNHIQHLNILQMAMIKWSICSFVKHPASLT